MIPKAIKELAQIFKNYGLPLTELQEWERKWVLELGYRERVTPTAMEHTGGKILEASEHRLRRNLGVAIAERITVEEQNVPWPPRIEGPSLMPDEPTLLHAKELTGRTWILLETPNDPDEAA